MLDAPITGQRPAVEVLRIEPLTVREADAARLIGVSVPTMRRWRASNEAPPHVKKNGTILYHLAELRAWLKGSG